MYVILNEARNERNEESPWIATKYVETLGDSSGRVAPIRMTYISIVATTQLKIQNSKFKIQNSKFSFASFPKNGCPAPRSSTPASPGGNSPHQNTPATHG